MRPTAISSSAFAPRPYTVSVGKATRRPARINSAARSISALFREVFLAIAGDLAGVLIDEVGVHEFFKVAVEHAVHVADAELGAVVLDQTGTAPAHSCGSGCRS